MTAYDRVTDFLKELGALCLWHTRLGAGGASEWQIGPERVVLTRLGDGGIRVDRGRKSQTRPRIDHLLDSFADLAGAPGRPRVGDPC